MTTLETLRKIARINIKQQHFQGINWTALESVNEREIVQLSKEQCRAVIPDLETLFKELTDISYSSNGLSEHQIKYLQWAEVELLKYYQQEEFYNIIDAVQELTK